MFPTLYHVDDLRPHVAAKKEIRFQSQPNGTTLACYMFMDAATFDTPQSLECRGIAFDREGRVCSRPLHKFFNAGEKEHLCVAALQDRRDLAGVFEKLDGSMLATAWVDDALQWRSKKSFGSDVVRLTQAHLAEPGQAPLVEFATEVARSGWTAVFELTHPQARIVVAHQRPQLRLLHVRDNVTGRYLLLDATHPVHALVRRFAVPCVPRFEGLTVVQALASLETMSEQEGYVLQFADGDMVKVKCPWYNRLHRSITFLRERDIALSALNEELDDLKAVLAEAGVDLGPVCEVEARLKTRLLGLMDELEATAAEGRELDRKHFALKFRDHPLFGLLMQQYLGKDVDLKGWYARTHLKTDFGLRVLADGALAEAMEA